MTEAEIILYLQRSFSSPIGKGFVVFSARWLIYLLIPFVLMLRLFPKMRDVFLPSCWAALLAFATTSVIAGIVHRVRPYLAGAGIHALVPPNLQSGSFPSSHTAIAAAIAAAITTTHPIIGCIACIIAIVIAFGRVAAGMHYPSDVIGGAAIGLLSALIVRAVQEGMVR
ncbi:MAG: phosphatase PAP2 family protein [Patescibacteria group bacterium]